jgi:mobilization protein NikA
MTAPPRDFAEPTPASAAPAVIHLGPPPDLAARKKARSGSEKRQRSAGILVKLTPADHQRVKAEAAAAGMSAAGYLASGRLGEERAFRPRLRRRPINEPALMRALAAFHRANNNLNQTARTGNTMMLFAEEHGAVRLAEIGRDLVRAVEEVRADLAPALAAILAAVSGDPQG